jgi:hypothetical protein
MLAVCARYVQHQQYRESSISKAQEGGCWLSVLSTYNTSNTVYHQSARRRRADGVQSVCASYDTVYHQSISETSEKSAPTKGWRATYNTVYWHQ